MQERSRATATQGKPKLLRSILWVLAGIVAVLVVLGAIAYLRFDPQSFGPQVATRIEQMTGRKATIGKISLKLFPAPAVAVSPVTIANAPGTAGDALRIESLAVRVRVMPLLSGRLEVASIVIDKPVLYLVRNDEGVWSFADILQRASAKPAGSPPPEAAPESAPASKTPGLSVGVEQARVRDGRIEIADDAVVPGRRSTVVIAPVDAAISGFGMGTAATLKLSAGLGESTLESTARLSGRGKARVLELSVPASRLEMSDLAGLLPWLGVAQPDGLAVSGSVTVAGKAAMPLERVETFEFEGTATLDDASYQDATMKRPIQKLGGKLSVTGDRAQIDDFHALLGDSDVKGRLIVENFLRPRIDAALESDRLDLNQVLEAFAGGSATADTGFDPSHESRQGLLNVRAKGTLAVKSMRFQTFDVADVHGTLKLDDAVLALEGLKAKLYGGSLDGRGSVDLSRAVPKESIQVALAGVDVNAAATAYDASLKDILRGSLSGNLAIEAAGLQMEPLLDTVRGQAKLEILKGSLTSISILKHLAAVLEAAGGKGVGRDETPFESLRGTFAIGDRKAITEDLMLHSTDLDMGAQGAVGLDATLDLKGSPSLSPEVTKAMVAKTGALARFVDANGRLTIHLTAKGTLAAPSIAVDLSAQTRELREKLGKDTEDKLKQKLRDKLKGILGK